MKICVAQTRPVAGDIEVNIDKHQKLIDLAVSDKTDVIIFPELSVTGYEPRQATQLAITRDDRRLQLFQTISDAHAITIGVGVPLKINRGTLISMIIFQPYEPKEIYSKQFLHQDELPYFVSGERHVVLARGNTKIAPAICYELSVPGHSAKAFEMGAEIYTASVAKSAAGVKKAIEILSGIAVKYSMTVLMSNCVGLCDGVECAGQSSIWTSDGTLVGQLNDNDEGLLIFDTERRQLARKIISQSP